MEEINRERVKELLNIARELASREPKSEPHSEYYAKLALEYHSKREEMSTDWERVFVFNLGCMEIALELEKDRKRLDTTAAKLASRNSNPKTPSEFLAKCALSAHREGDYKECDKSLIYMGCFLRVEDIIRGGGKIVEINREWVKELLNIARELASRESNSEPHSEFFAKLALEYYSKQEELSTGWERVFVFNLGCMEIALELEKDQKDRKELETIAEELASRNSKPESGSEYYARRALRAHKEYDRFLINMRWYLKGKRWKKSIEREASKIAEVLAAQNSKRAFKHEPGSEYYAKLASKFHKEGDQKLYDRFLVYMDWILKEEKRLRGGGEEEKDGKNH